MSLAQGYPSTFSPTEQTHTVLHNLDNETKKIYVDVNAIMASGGHAHTGSGSDGAQLNSSSLIINSAINEATGANIASASTVNLITATGNFLHITGTTTITAITLGAGMRREVIFDGVLTLTHHTTNNNLPSGANIITAVGDRATYYSDGTTVYCTKYAKASGTAVTTCMLTTIRQTVLSGAVDATGQAAHLQIGTGLAVNELATTTPTVTTWANGFDANGSVDYMQRLTATVTSAWSSLTASSTLYLYKERNASTGAVTYGFTTLSPSYQTFAVASPATNQYWFDMSAMVGQYYSGSAWTSTQRVFVGECVTGVSTVTSVTSYQFKGKYVSDIFSVAINTLYTKSSNMGITPEDISILYRINAADTTIYKVYPMSYYNSAAYGHGAVNENSRNAVKLQTGTQLLTYHNSFFTDMDSYSNKTTGYYQVIAKRGW